MCSNPGSSSSERREATSAASLESKYSRIAAAQADLKAETECPPPAEEGNKVPGADATAPTLALVPRPEARVSSSIREAARIS